MNIIRAGSKQIFNTLQLTISRSISHTTWKGKEPYTKGSKEQQQVIDRAFEAAKDQGFDAQGAKVGQIAGYRGHCIP